MEHTSFCTASGSSFRDVKGHTWYAAQFSFNYDTPMPWDIVRDYWENGQGKVVINYEGKYDHLWTKIFGSRAQGWIAFLNGMYGYGYGAQGIWDVWFNNEDTYDGKDIITPEDKIVTWQKALQFPSGDQMTILRSFFEEYEWWKLTPRFDDKRYLDSRSSFRNEYNELITRKNIHYSLATIDNDLYVLYLFNNTTQSATLKGLSNTIYTAKWFNPRTGEYINEKNVFILTGRYKIEEKPDSEDWVFVMEKKVNISFYMILSVMLVVIAQISRQTRVRKKKSGLT